MIAAFLEVDVVPDLLDWTQLKLVNVALAYDDDEGEIHEKEDLVFRPGDTTKTWKIPIADEAKTGYTSLVTYFLVAGSERRTVGPTDETTMSVFLELPTA